MRLKDNNFVLLVLALLVPTYKLELSFFDLQQNLLQFLPKVDLLKLLEERKQQFIKEGLFDTAHKKPIAIIRKRDASRRNVPKAWMTVAGSVTFRRMNATIW